MSYFKFFFLCYYHLSFKAPVGQEAKCHLPCVSEPMVSGVVRRWETEGSQKTWGFIQSMVF